MRSASEYLSDLNPSDLSIEERNIARKFAAKMEAIDFKLMALKGERRAMANWLLALKARKAKASDDDPAHGEAEDGSDGENGGDSES